MMHVNELSEKKTITTNSKITDFLWSLKEFIFICCCIFEYFDILNFLYGWSMLKCSCEILLVATLRVDMA